MKIFIIISLIMLGEIFISPSAFANCVLGTVNGLQEVQCASLESHETVISNFSKSISCGDYSFTIKMTTHFVEPIDVDDPVNSPRYFNWDVTIAGPHGQASADSDHLILLDSGNHGAFIRCE